MPRDGQGNYNPPLNSWNPAVDGNEADPAGWNELRDDITSALSQSVSSDGQTMMTGNLRMGGNQIQNLGQPMGNGFALRRDQLIKGSNIPSASTINIPAEGSLFEVTGTSTINQITGAFDGRVAVLVFQDALTIKHSPSLDLPGQRDIKTEPKDSLIFYRKDSLSWSCINLGINAATQQEVDGGENDAKFVTPKKLRAGISMSLTATAGYLAFPSWLFGGLIFQYVRNYSDGSPSTTIGMPYPIPFPNAIFGAWITPISLGLPSSSSISYHEDDDYESEVGRAWISPGGKTVRQLRRPIWGSYASILCICNRTMK